MATRTRHHFGVGGIPRFRSLGVLALILCLLALSSTVAEVAVAAATANTYSTPCTFPSSSFNQGSTVYGGGSGLTGTSVDIEYVNPSNVAAQTTANVAVSGGSACDSAGFLIPLTAPTGSWTLRICTPAGGNCKNPAQGQQASSAFTVNAAVPDLPSGVVALLVPVAIAYFLSRRSLIGKD